MFVTNAGVRNLLHTGDWNSTADRVRLLAMTDFLNHAGAADGSQFGAWNPATAANRAVGLAATGARAVIASGRRAALGADWARNLFGFGYPVTCADFDLASFGDWLADRVADIAVAGFGFGFVGGAADFPALRFVNRLADRAADVAVAGLIAGLTNGAADVAVASLIARLADGAADVAVAGLEARLTDRTADIAITGLVARLADGVALVPIAGFGDITGAGDRNLLRALLVNGAAAVIRLLFPDRFTNRLVTGTAAALGSAIRTAGRTGCGGAAFRAGCSAVERFDS